MPLTDRFAQKPLDPLADDPELRKKHQDYLKEYRKRLKQLEYEASEDFLERPYRGT